MTSPIVTINGQPTEGGYDAAPGEALVIALADHAGVDFWQLDCVGTASATTLPESITASLVRDEILLTASLTAPGYGSALLFKSIVNHGRDHQGNPVPSYSTTFIVHVPSSDGYRVIAANETLESNELIGWLDQINQRIRFGGSGTGGGFGGSGKMRVYRSSPNQAGAAVTVNRTMVWNGTSSLVTASNVTLIGGSTQLQASSAGHFLCEGQLTISPTTDAVSGVTIEVLQNGSTVVHTVSDYGAVWGVGLNRSLPFAFPIDLLAGDTLEVRWRHSGSAASAQSVILGDNLSWFALSR